MRAIIPAAGLGQRMQSITAGRSKLALELRGMPILEYTLRSLAGSPLIKHFTIATSLPEESWVAALAKRALGERSFDVVLGGETRQESVAKALGASPADSSEFVMVHDGARPFCGSELIQRVSDEAVCRGAAIAALPSISTLKRVVDGVIVDTVRREEIYEAQTPQIFRADLLGTVHSEARSKGREVTDDAQLFEQSGHKVSVVEGQQYNIKITHPADIPYAEYLIDRALVPVHVC